MIEKIKRLTEQLLVYANEYYNLDSPSISDQEYDKLYDELEALENEHNFWLSNSPTRKVQGKVLDKFNKVIHSKPMLSANKTKDINVVKKFLADKHFYTSYKLDGLTLVVKYKDGEFISAVTRGSGLQGEDVTEQAKMITNLPLRIPYEGELELRGECVVSWNMFRKINETLEVPFSHPRNMASGSLRNLDANVTRERKLSFIPFESVTYVNDSKLKELEFLDSIGFTTVNRVELNDVDECVSAMSPQYSLFPVDGLIFEIDSKQVSNSLGITEHHENCRIALKWEDTVYTTTLRDVVWSTNKTGAVTPVAIFDEVDLDGALTTKATLHNVEYVKKMKLGIGDSIGVIRSNMVIPKVLENYTNSNNLPIPEVCPCCGAPLEIRISDLSACLYCTGDNCRDQKIALLEHFISKRAANIEGMSTATLEFLFDSGIVSNFIDLYKITDEQYAAWCEEDGYGEVSVKNLRVAIENSRNIELTNFINALSIPNVGFAGAKTIAKYCNNDVNEFIEHCLDIDFDWEALEDFGLITSMAIKRWVKENMIHTNMLQELIPEFNFIKPIENISTINKLSGKAFCITGKLNKFVNRDALVNNIELFGGKFVSGVSAKCDYLINNDFASASSKNKKAKELNIPIITEEEYLKMIQ